MNKNKKAVAIISVVAFFVVALGAWVYFTAGGRNVFASGTSFAISSWNSAFGGDDAEIVDTSTDISDDSASSSDLFSGNDDAAEENVPSDDVSVPQNLPASDNVVNNFQKVESDASVQESNAATDNENPSMPVAATTPVCKFPSASSALPGKIILNEIAWMGSPPAAGENNSDAGKNEWIELKNISSGTVSLAGWQVADISGKVRIIFGANSPIDPGGFAVVARGASSSFAGPFPVAAFYSAALGNSGDTVAVIDPSCNASDIISAATGWPGGNNTTKQTLERDADHNGWHTSVDAGGTPGAENSVPIITFTLSVSVAGDGHGTVGSSPSGISCAAGNCAAVFASGTAISLAATPDSNSLFEGWTSACSGTGNCSLYIEGPETVSAMFRAVLPVPVTDGPAIGDPAVPQASSTPAVSAPQPSSTSVSGMHPLIAAVQIAGASSTNDIVKIFNPSGSSIDVSGWRLRKRSSTGSDSSIKVFPDGAAIPSLGYFIWANSSGGFSEAVGANISSTETLSAENSVALFDASGTAVDALAWGSGVNQYAEGAPFPADPDAGKWIARIVSGGVMVDTGNNAADFVLQ